MEKLKFIEHFLFPPTYLNKDKLSKELNNKTVLITGASSGIGESLAYSLQDYNVHLIIAARTKSKLLNIKNSIEKYNAKVSIYSIDLRNTQEVEKFILYLKSFESGIDFFINNAGKSIMRSIFNSLDRFHDFQRTMNVNYFAPVQLMLSLIPLLKETSGQVINISTINVLILPFPHWAAYQASKSAFDNWFRSVSPELNINGISTSSIYLPLVKTPMISSTKLYQNSPAMSSNHVSKIILKIIYTKKNMVKPWWLIFLQLSSIFFKKPLEYILLNIFKKGADTKND